MQYSAAMTRRIGPLLALGAVAAALVAVVLVAVAVDVDYVIAGLADPGALTRYGGVVVRVLATVAAVVCTGSLLLAAFLVPPQANGRVDTDGFAALRTASGAAWVWVGAALLSVLFTSADAVGLPVTDMLSSRRLVVVVDAAEQPKAWLLTALLALVLALGCQAALSWRSTVALFALAVLALVPVAVTGHSASGGSHDVATASLLYHLVAAALWVGGLVALLATALRGGRHLALAARRFSALALVCWVVMAVSGVVNSLVRVPLADLFGTPYGLLVVAKAAALGALGVVGYRQRRAGVAALTARDERRPLLRLAAVEVLLMLATVGLAAALSRTPPPGSGVPPSTLELMIGYELDGGPLTGRFDLVFGTAALVLAALYLAGVRRLRGRGRDWPVRRTVGWLAGCAVLLVATSSAVGAYAPAMFSAHVLAHLLLAVVVPLLLVLGAPVSLWLRAVPAAAPGAAPGPREWSVSLLRSPAARALTHPGIAFGLLAGPFYVLYYAEVLDWTLGVHWAHLAMNALFLVGGYLFFWIVIGPDPAPRRSPPVARVGLMAGLLAAFGYLAVVVLNKVVPVGEGYYRTLDLPWVGDLMADQRLGGLTIWLVGELPALVLLIVTAVQWARADERDATSADRRSGDADHDDDLAAYNAMLSSLDRPRR